MVQLSLFDLVQAGHRIVAVTYDQVQTDQEGNISGGDHTFFLQKNQEVHKCIESHASNMKSLETTGRMFCWKLVQPHPLREKK